ncbi:MAG TPA: hypothetical protein VEB43_16605 [Anaeromyxobacter sp.]|nr:hypothetical protein [Anaeromyxobacter sp.]
MRRIALIVTGMLALAGCGGGGGWKATCSATKPCEAGNYCADTPDGNVCWPDSEPPQFASTPTATCNGTRVCRRTDTLHVEAVVTDDAKMGTVEVELGLEPVVTRALQKRPDSDTFEADISLAEVPFDRFDAENVAVTFTARDEAQTPAVAAEAEDITITRLAWKTLLRGASDTAYRLFMPAVLDDAGRLGVVGTDGSLHLVTNNGVEERAPIALGTQVDSSPAAGAGVIWVAGLNGQLYKRAAADGAAISLTDCTTTTPAPLVGPPAVLGDRAIVVSAGNEILVARTTNACNTSNASAPITTSPALDSAGRLLLGTGATLRRFAIAANSAVSDAWGGLTPSVGSVVEPLGIGDLDVVWSVATNGGVYRTDALGTAHLLSESVSAGSAGAVVLSDGTAVLADASGVLRRVSSAGTPTWGSSVRLSGQPRTPLVLSSGEPTLLVTTSTGSVFAVRAANGEIAWSGRPTTYSLAAPNIWTEPGASTSTAYLAGADGYLYAVIVDGTLDTSAPWPKAYHDPQNTSNANGNAGVTP